MTYRFEDLIALAFALLWAGITSAQDPSPRTFEVDVLNPQLGPVPEEIDRSTPRATMAGLMQHAADGNAAAAHYLNVSALEGGTAQAQRRARELARVIERTVSPDWRMLTDRADGLLDTAPNEMPQAGEIRRSILIGHVEMEPQAVPVRINRLEASGQAPVWVFSRTTVDAVPAMYAQYGPSALEKMLPDSLRVEAWFGLMWWEFLALPLALALTALAAWVSWRLTGWIGQGSRWGARMARAARMPVALLAGTGMAAVLVGNFFAFSSEISHFVQPAVALGLALALLLFVLRTFDVVLEDLVSFDDATLQSATEDKNRALATKVSAMRRILLIVIVLVAGTIALHELQLSGGLELSFLASAGLLTLLLGFAARTILGNILASLQIALNQSARIGDKLVYKGTLCNVERLHFTYVQLRVWTNVRLIVPVSEFVSEPFENWTAQERPMVRLIRLKMAQDADIDQMRIEFDRIMDELDPEQLDDRDGSFVLVSDQDVLGIEVMFGLPCANPDTAWKLSCAAREGLVKAALRLEEDEGIRMFSEASASEAAA